MTIWYLHSPGYGLGFEVQSNEVRPRIPGTSFCNLHPCPLLAPKQLNIQYSGFRLRASTVGLCHEKTVLQ